MEIRQLQDCLISTMAFLIRWHLYSETALVSFIQNTQTTCTYSGQPHHHTLHLQSAMLSSVNSLAPRRFQFNIRKIIFKLTLVNGGWGISYEIALRWMPQGLTHDKSTLVQVMAWCHQATSHYLSQCWPRSMSPNGVTRPHWVNSLRHGNICISELGHHRFM